MKSPADMTDSELEQEAASLSEQYAIARRTGLAFDNSRADRITLELESRQYEREDRELRADIAAVGPCPDGKGCKLSLVRYPEHEERAP